MKNTALCVTTVKEKNYALGVARTQVYFTV